MTAAYTILDAMVDDQVFAPFFAGPSWDGWRTVLKAAYALPITETEREFFRSVAERAPPTTRPVRELWIIAGRRAGKDAIASLITAFTAALFEAGGRLRPGERALAACLACDRDQARIVLNYTRAFFRDIPLLASMVERETANGFQLSNSVDVAISTNNFRSTRGRPVLTAVLDECAFFRDESSSSAPDIELYRALQPGTATIPGSMIIGISTPYRKAGLLFQKFKQHYGRDGDVLVIKAPSIMLNPTLDQRTIDDALEDDRQAAQSEWLAEFRDDISGFIDREAVEALVVRGRRALPPTSGIRYSAFCDPSGGSSDSMTLAIAHQDRTTKRALVDTLLEVRPKFSPEAVVGEFSAVLKNYVLHKVVGDRYGGLWPAERFAAQGVVYEPSERTKSDIYRDVLPLMTSGRVELLDHPRLIAQLCGIERRTARGGKDSFDHGPGPGAHDDVANAACGALVLAAGKMDPLEIFRRAFDPYATT